MAIRVTKIAFEVSACAHEVDKYGEEGLKRLWENILERYAHEEWYDPDLVHEILDHQEEEVTNGRT